MKRSHEILSIAAEVTAMLRDEFKKRGVSDPDALLVLEVIMAASHDNRQTLCITERQPS